jgi:hypothetical protein
MTTHTPGPWSASFGNLIRVMAKPGHITVCGVHKIGRQTGEYGQQEQREVEANATLIAAAPDMLAALKLARECIAYCRMAHKDAQSGDGMPVEVILDAAIAKAEGRS